MSRQFTQLPSFRTPPVVEVALSVQFKQLVKLRAAHMGLFWDMLRSRFPSLSETSPITPVIERFGQDRFQKAEVNVKLLEMPPVPRILLSNKSKTELIQVQQDRLVHNWRKVGKGDIYPRYEHIRGAFMGDLQMFRKFIREGELGDIEANQCEVSYVNHIDANDKGEHLPLEHILPSWQPRYSDSFLRGPEQARFDVSYVIQKNESIRGRLRISVNPGLRNHERLPIYILTLIARAAPEESSDEAILEALDLGREWIVRGFTSITSSAMHTKWGRDDDH